MVQYSQPHPKVGMMKCFSPSCNNLELFIRSEICSLFHVFSLGFSIFSCFRSQDVLRHAD